MCRESRRQFEFEAMWNWWAEIKERYARTRSLSDVEKRSLLDLRRWADEEGLAIKSAIEALLRENGITRFVGPYFEFNVKPIKQEEVKSDILDTMVRRANEIGVQVERKGSKRETVLANQFRYIKHGKGELYPHPRDEKAWKHRGETSKVHTFLPGYATGDRYTAVLTMLLDPRLCLVIAFEEGAGEDEKNARSAYQTVLSALTANDIDPSDRVCLLSHTGSLRDAREVLNTQSGRTKYKHVFGYKDAPLLDRELKEHVYHISITTVIMAEAWGDDYTAGHVLRDKSNLLRARILKMIPRKTVGEIDVIVEEFIQEKALRNRGAVALWIANRANANAREAEAISNPYMFEQIRYAIEATGRSCFFIADGFLNKGEGNRHRFKTSSVPDVGTFWNHESGLFRVRENQWYFLDRLFTEIGCHTIIGIRSGALEPIALLGHNVIYLEHQDMFTPERHGAWQGRIPYSRLMTCNRTGYYEKTHLKLGGNAIEKRGLSEREEVVQDEVARDFAVKDLISKNLLLKQKLGPTGGLPVVPDHALRIKEQDAIANVTGIIEEGVLLPTEIEILLKMLEKKLPAFRVV